MSQYPDKLSMQHHSRRAFSLAETVVVVAITSVVGIAITGSIAYFYKANAFVLQQVSSIDSAHRGLDISFRNLREASYGDDGSYPIASVATSSIIFFSDVDNDGVVEKIRLYLLNGTLYRTVANSAGSPPSYVGQTEATSTIATTVVNSASTPIFRYYNSAGTELTGTINLSQITSIETRLDVDLNPLRAPDLFTLKASATLRNLRTQ
ncbi:MAG: hypothetical protein JWN64_602 [Parcubacteria group bacterium]|nr:hypothetical protein [Parcubacteria group bacterium]